MTFQEKNSRWGSGRPGIGDEEFRRHLALSAGRFSISKTIAVLWTAF